MRPVKGIILDNYKLLAQIGAGSCGSVWQAENIVSGEVEALKILSGNTLAERELRALKLYREINHPALIRVRHIGRAEDTLFYTMDWCECSLAERKCSASELLKIAKTLAEGLSVLHSSGLLHRDIKPANIFFRQGSPVLGDIGLLTRLEGATFAGTPGFLAPAILRGKGTADCYSDCYALAKSLYCALSGLGPEQFPFYTGEMTPETSLLMRAVLAVCSDPPQLHNAGEFLNFLKNPPRKKSPYSTRIRILLPVVIIGIASGVWLSQKKQDQPVKSEEIKPVQPVGTIREKPVATEENKQVQQEKISLLPKAEPVQQKTGKIQKTEILQPQVERKTEPVQQEPEQKIKTQTREQLEKDFTALPPEAAEKLRRLQQSAEISRLLNHSGQNHISPPYEKRMSKVLTQDQQKVYWGCSKKIKEMQSSMKWLQLKSLWSQQNRELMQQIRDLEKKEDLDAGTALQKVAEKAPVLTFWIRQAECLTAQSNLMRAAQQKKHSEIPRLLDLYSQKTEDCCRIFAGITP